MSKILVVEDEIDQLNMRRQILEQAGYEVATAQTASEALERLPGAQVVLMDLQVPTAEDGLQLIRAASGTVRIVVLSGAESDVKLPVDEYLIKPCSSRKLLETIARLCMLLFCLSALHAESFKVAKPIEMIAELDLRARGTDWAKEGHEAALASVILDDSIQQYVMLYAGAEPFTYKIFLGFLTAGTHSLEITGEGVQVMKMRFHDDSSDVVAHAPILYARPNTIGKFTDIPLMVYCERSTFERQRVLQYTVIFSNEDGGTSTAALMARWGRTTDIEYVYRVFLAEDGSRRKSIIQTKEHKEIEFDGIRESMEHPLLMPITDNNMIGEYDDRSSIRYQIAPILVDATGHSREQIMDEHPILYKVAAQELKREGKLREYGKVDGEKIGDPRNYLYFEMRLAKSESSIATLVRLNGDPRWHSSHLGRTDLAIRTWSRNSAESPNGFVRTTVELPPGTKANQIAEIGFQCVVPEKASATPCRVEAVTKCFFLDQEYRPGDNIWTLTSPHEIAAGNTWTSALK